jgi:hypothetical protein
VTRALFVVLLAMVALVAGCAHRPAAAPSTWQLYGVVVSVEKGSFTVRHKSGHIVTLNIDAAQGGLGSNSCGPGPLEQYLLRPEPMTLEFAMRPAVHGADDLFAKARRIPE